MGSLPHSPSLRACPHGSIALNPDWEEVKLPSFPDDVTLTEGTSGLCTRTAHSTGGACAEPVLGGRPSTEMCRTDAEKVNSEEQEYTVLATLTEELQNYPPKPQPTTEGNLKRI